jgi:7-cyano-7-deazaguanine synthase
VNASSEFVGERVAVLVSGGLDSAILVAELMETHREVHPLYVRHGYQWEGVEERYLRRYLEAIGRLGLEPLKVLEMPLREVLPAAHWGVSGRGVPGSETPDEAVYLPARNLLLLSKALLYCYELGIPAVALGVLRSNPFPDATPEFFAGLERTFNQAVQGSVRIVCPYQAIGKREVMLRGRGLPLEWSFSCIQPVGERHCGRCNKCEERRHAFASAGMADPTVYAE